MLSEADLQAQVVELAGMLGWRVLHVRRSIGKGNRWTTATSVVGWPDLFMWHPAWRRVVAAELKAEKGRATTEQTAVLASLALAGIETHLWRPSDWPAIEVALGSRRPAVTA
jgi:hypothetical protein